MADATPNVVRFRKLQIAVSVFFGVVTRLLCMLWVRSYWWNQIVTQLNTQGFRTTIGANRGWMYVHYGRAPELAFSGLLIPNKWRFDRHDSTRFSDPSLSPRKRDAVFWMHCNLLSGLAASVAYIAWPRSSLRFALRTLLIATTLIALVLGLVVWAGR